MHMSVYMCELYCMGNSSNEIHCSVHIVPFPESNLLIRGLRFQYPYHAIALLWQHMWETSTWSNSSLPAAAELSAEPAKMSSLRFTTAEPLPAKATTASLPSVPNPRGTLTADHKRGSWTHSTSISRPKSANKIWMTVVHSDAHTSCTGLACWSEIQHGSTT